MHHNIVTWDRLAQTCGEFLGKGQQVAIEGRIQTRSWDDDRGQRHWKTEIVANHVEMLSGRRKKDYAAESAANGLAAQAAAYGEDADEDEAAAIAAAAEPLGEVPDHGQNHDADEERRQADCIDDWLDRADEDLRQDREQDGCRDEDDRRGSAAPARRPGQLGVRLASECRIGVGELVDDRE